MADDAAGQQQSVNRIISHAVDLGYKVIEDQIRQGRQAAERFRAGAYNSGDAEEDIKKLMERMLYLVKELGVVGFDLASAVIRDPRSSSALGGSDLVIETHTARPVRVKYHVDPTSSRFVPSVPALYSANRDVPPLRSVRFEVRDNRPLLVVDIPDRQPAGIYAGAIVDMESNQAAGFISISLS
jgi:hypothetical protein